ncbi:hypothetical protein AKJ43_03470 [candidate division MSBL1 archaeon SCGC-AAA261D19]|uniref:Uncharacterized protein n=1 Tax=candidate division MSBL1 archaeon SCGC-AAA261D19 TaxID=1698273 RepID=A0A133V4H7_9EURY|nr:hypothetical protein AKJ43_03470 [candidate division MSBL1 archaeon SCGC-AAA261D19]
MMENRLLKKLFSKVDLILKLELGEIQRAHELVEEILCGSKEILNIPQNKGVEEELEDILSRLEKWSGELSRSVLNSERCSLSQDWVRFARNDFAKLKDEILALREFLVRHQRGLQKSLNEARYGADLEDLVELLWEEEIPHRAILGQLTKRLSEMNETERQRATEIFSKRISRMSLWLSILQEARQDIEDNAG